MSVHVRLSSKSSVVIRSGPDRPRRRRTVIHLATQPDDPREIRRSYAFIISADQWSGRFRKHQVWNDIRLGAMDGRHS
jgi:hypothetical protein